jgi:meso-butanediol dehydrogenase/(S,S)-butanediol dehydrogenase/diacetyl reductase
VTVSRDADRPVGVVTGAARGIGRSIAIGLARVGFDLVVNFRTSAHRVDSLLSEAESHGSRAIAWAGDVVDPKTADQLAATALETFGRVDVWVNNDGVSVLAPLLETTAEEMEWMTSVNLLGAFHGLRAAGEVMTAQGRGGLIVNVASDLGLRAAPLLAGYSATKFGVIGLSQAAALELARVGVRVNAVCPGTVESDMVMSEIASEARWRGMPVAAVRQGLCDAVPLGRLCTADDVSALVVWLTTPGAAFVTGQAICTNGGAILH